MESVFVQNRIPIRSQEREVRKNGMRGGGAHPHAYHFFGNIQRGRKLGHGTGVGDRVGVVCGVSVAVGEIVGVGVWMPSAVITKLTTSP